MEKEFNLSEKRRFACPIQSTKHPFYDNKAPFYPEEDIKEFIKLLKDKPKTTQEIFDKVREIKAKGNWIESPFRQLRWIPIGKIDKLAGEKFS